jgi:metallo-beta-lactamase class B
MTLPVAALLLASASSITLGPDLEVRELQPGVWLHVSVERGIPANGLIVRTPAGLVLVDTGWNDSQAERLMAWTEKDLHAPIARAIVTHSHVDRSGGMAALVRRKIPVGASDLTIAKVRAAGGPAGDVLLAAGPDASAKGPGFEVFYPGAGHTADNVVVWLPETRILFGGCFVKAETAEDLGNIADADLTAWPMSVAAVRGRYPSAATVVPGHGPVGGMAALDRTVELLRRRPATP